MYINKKPIVWGLRLLPVFLSQVVWGTLQPRNVFAGLCYIPVTHNTQQQFGFQPTWHPNHNHFAGEFFVCPLKHMVFRSRSPFFLVKFACFR